MTSTCSDKLEKLYCTHLRRRAWVGVLLVVCWAPAARADVAAQATHTRPGPFTFMYGLDRGGRLDDLEALGLNTLYIDLRVEELRDLAPVRSQIRETAAAGYKVIVGIPTTGAERGVAAMSETYRAWVEDVIRRVVGGLGDEPGVTAWATGLHLEKHISYPDAEFQDFLESRYRGLDELNRYWAGSFRTWPAVGQRVALDHGAAMPFGIGRAAVDVADYRTAAFGAVMRHWAQVIREIDEVRPLLTGCLSLYRSIPAVPETYDVIVVGFPPDIMTADPRDYGDHLTHNAHGIDMARRGGRFDVIQVLRIPFAGEPGYGTGLRDWILEADMRGACGVGLDSWERLEHDPNIWSPTRRPLTQALPAVDFSGRPEPTIAVLYSPYAEGFAVAGQPVYGHLAGFATGQPNTFFEALRGGTCFGPVDYLTPDELEHVSLDRYGVLVAPAAVGLSLRHAGLLGEYVRSGGALLADIGIGLHTTGDWLSLPEPLATVFGVRALVEGTARAGTLSVAGELPWLPHLVRGMKSGGTFRAQMGGGAGAETYQAGSYAVGSYAAYAALMQGARVVALLDVNNAVPDTPLFAGIVGAEYGRGVAVFATHLLYQHWPLVDTLSSALHYDLFKRRRICELLNEPLLPTSTEISFEGNRLRLLNAAREPRGIVAALHAGDDHLLADALTINHAAYTAGEANQQVEVTVPGNSLVTLPMTPIKLQPYSSHVASVIAEISAGRVHLSVAGPGAVFKPTRAQPYQFTRPDHAVRVRFQLLPGSAYELHEGALHSVTMETERGKTRRFDVPVKNGALSFTEEVYRELVTIEPAASAHRLPAQ